MVSAVNTAYSVSSVPAGLAETNESTHPQVSFDVAAAESFGWGAESVADRLPDQCSIHTVERDHETSCKAVW